MNTRVVSSPGDTKPCVKYRCAAAELRTSDKIMFLIKKEAVKCSLSIQFGVKPSRYRLYNNTKL